MILLLTQARLQVQMRAGSTFKNAQDIIPESGDLSTAELPTTGSTTPITYTGTDGNSFTFYAKWPDSFTTGINCTDTEDATYIVTKIKDSKYHVDLDTLNPNDYYKMDSGIDLSEYVITDPTIKAATFGEMKSAIQTAIKGLYNYWLREGAKLNYDMFMRFIAKQGLNTTQLVGNSSQAETFSYNTKSAIITNYDEGDTINFYQAVDDFEISNTLNDFIVDSPSEISNVEINMLAVRDVRGKTMTFNTSYGADTFAYGYGDENDSVQNAKVKILLYSTIFR